MSKYYFKAETVGVWRPAQIRANRCTENIHLAIQPTYCVDPRVQESYPEGRQKPPAFITLSPDEAIGLAAWLSNAAETIQNRKRRAAVRKAALKATKEGKGAE